MRHNVRFFEFLSSIESLTDEERAELTEAAEYVVFGPGEILIEEGTKPGGLFVLTSGRVEIRKRVSGHGDRLLAILDASNEKTVVGERGLLSDREASATVRAREKAEAVKIPSQKFRMMIADGRIAAYKLIYRIARILAERMARNNEVIVEIAAELETAGSNTTTRELDVFRNKLMKEWSF